MGGRPSRNWVRKTLTISPSIDRQIRELAAKQDIDPGTVVDVILWNRLIKPKNKRSAKRLTTPEEIDRYFAEDVLEKLDKNNQIIAHIIKTQGIPDFEEFILYENYESPSDEKVKSFMQNLWRKWRRTRYIEPKYRYMLLMALADVLHYTPRVLMYDLVDHDWFS